MTTEPKKLAPLRILQILQKYSSPNHPLLQEEIAERLHEYGIDLERKAIGRNLACLSDAGFDVVNIPKRGYYLETLGFDAFDLCLIVDAILCSEHITEDRAGELLYKLKSLTHDTLPFVANRVERRDERSEDDLWDLFCASTCQFRDRCEDADRIRLYGKCGKEALPCDPAQNFSFRTDLLSPCL